MKKYFLFLIIFVSLFYLPQNSEAATKYACETCTPSPIDPCYSYYSSGNTCYYGGISCKSGGVSFSQNWCMSFATAVDRTGPLDANKEYCSGPSPTHYEGYANKDSSDPRTDTQCQDKVCGSSGWSVQNKLDNTICTYSGQSSKCISGICQVVTPPVTCNYNGIQDNGETGTDCGGGGCADCSVPVCTSCSADGTLVGACNSAGKRCSSVGGVCSLYSDSSCAASACSGWGNMGDCNGDYNCKWCSSVSSCALYSDTCPIADNCNAQTSKSACDQQTGGSTSYACGWCPNSYSGGTSANGGDELKTYLKS